SHADALCRVLSLAQLALLARMRRSRQNGNARRFRHRLFENLQALADELEGQKTNACDVSAGPRQSFDQSGLDGIAAVAANDRQRRRGRLRGARRASLRDEEVDFLANELLRQLGELGSILIAAEFYFNVLPVD